MMVIIMSLVVAAGGVLWLKGVLSFDFEAVFVGLIIMLVGAGGLLGAVAERLVGP